MMIVNRDVFKTISHDAKLNMNLILIVDDDTFEVYKDKYTGKAGNHYPIDRIQECIGRW